MSVLEVSVKFTCVDEIEAIYERPCVNVTVERGSTFTFTHDPPYIVSTLFSRVKFTCVRTQKLRFSGVNVGLGKG